MDKQKQIEEMANFFKGILPIKAMADWIPIKINHNYKGYGEELYNAGYRKIPENAVVLTREEYERLYKLEYDNA
jgi:predicted RNA-binding protein